MKILQKLEEKVPHYSGMLFNFGGIALFAMIPAILILWLVFDQFQNADNPTQFTNYCIAASVGIITQQIVRTVIGKPFYKHWTNTVFMVVLFIIGFLTAAEKFGL